MRSWQPQKGFTLVEMVAATFLLALALGVLLPILGQLVRSVTQDEIHNRMAIVARSLIDEASMSPMKSDITKGERDGLHWYLECKENNKSKDAALFVLHLTLTSGSQVEVFTTARLQLLERARPL